MPFKTWKLAFAGAVALATAACGATEPPPHLRIEGGDVSTGRQLIRSYGCGTCHSIDGIPGAIGMVGPPLTGFARRQVLAGAYPNVPRHLVPWLVNPPALRPGTAMPNMGITAEEARHIATYLYSLGAERAATYEVHPTAAGYPWLDQAEAYRRAESRKLTDLSRIGPQHARIPIERAMELLATTPEASRQPSSSDTSGRP